MTLKLLDETPNSTLSGLYIDGKFQCFIIEDGNRDEKVWGETRIPAGTYKIRRKTEGKYFTKYGVWIPELIGVQGFSGILIHPGNYVKDTRGCLLPTQTAEFNPSKNEFFGLRSRPAFDLLHAKLDKMDNIQIEITR